MNPKTMRKINKHADSLLLSWLKTLIPEEDKEKVSIENLNSFLPSANYFYANKSLRLSFYGPKWARKCIKKLLRNGKELESITMKDLEDVSNRRPIQDEDD
tara:strand:- start:243 stop:545 length:303 start_codon:yes stop_codon:yes gene_type:complete